MTDVYSQIIKSINRANDIAIYCHTNPDGDTLCGALALHTALKNAGKEAVIYCDCPVPSKFSGLYGVENITFPQKGVHELAISVDCASVDRLGQCVKSYLSAKEQIAIDHHKTFVKFAEICLVEICAACSQIMYKFIKQYGKLDENIASLLFAGIVTDSGCFAFSSVREETHQIACDLLRYKFNAPDIIYDVYSSTELKKFKLKSKVLTKTRFFNDNQIAVIVFTQRDFNSTGADISCTEGIITELINIKDVKVAYALAETGTHNYKLSIRTKAMVDASDIATTMGGGGHTRAAGCRINGYLEDVIEKIVKLANDRL
ncbi:MAG: bifunctional oligoribonuclease/PAP phosphatase NrnA [Clostridia bacterium]|nr:bifunctional oligoribonuclease/PAP phosphatase NrnA [Clostridia bacterium]